MFLTFTFCDNKRLGDIYQFIKKVQHALFLWQTWGKSSKWSSVLSHVCFDPCYNCLQNNGAFVLASCICCLIKQGRSHYLVNNNCTPSFLRSLGEFVSDCFGTRYFSRECSSRRKIQRSKTITDEFTQKPKNSWCRLTMYYSLITAL